MTTKAVLNYGDSPVPKLSRKPRIWPGVAIVILQWLLIKVPAWVWPQTMIHFQMMMFGPIIGVLGILIWWLGFSRFPWSIRALGLVPLVLGPVVGFTLGDPTMKMAMVVFAPPVVTTVFVLWVVAASRLNRTILGAGLVIVPMLVWGFLCLRRMDGLNGSVDYSSSWRWAPTKEEEFLARLASDPSVAGRHHAPSATAPADLALSPGDWPEFRGANRDGKLIGVSINTDWNAHPPRQLWKHLIGPGWGSFSVVGDHVFTQEQRGGVEVVSCYNLNTGDEIWIHEDHTRFSEPMAGPGPRATPTFADGKLYSLGASGKLNCLNPATGDTLWQRDVKTDADAPQPTWGFSSSPLVHDGLVTVITGGKEKTVMAYDASTGQPRWSAGSGWSYASVQRAHLDGVDQLLAVTNDGIFAVDPEKGQVLWQHSFPIGSANRAIQPTILNHQELLLGAAFGIGTRRVKITHEKDTWNTESLWTSRKIKPYYNDMVLHKGNIYGFDGSTFTCIDPATGLSRWRAGESYGNGQVLLIADQDLLLILSETGDAALVDAKPEEFREIGRFHALDGKTWNHPVIAQGKLLVRNGEEVACFVVK
jgi:outer membrane protein assembly factor BamB